MHEPVDASLFPPPPTAAPGTEWGAEPVEEEDADRAAFQAELERVAAEVRLEAWQMLKHTAHARCSSDALRQVLSSSCSWTAELVLLGSIHPHQLQVACA